MAFLAPLAGSLGSVLSVGATVLSTVGTLASASAQAGAARYNAKVQQVNAQTSTEQAASIAATKNREMRQRLAAGRAAALQNGFDLAGSPLDILGQAEDTGNLDYLTAVYEGQVKATGYQNNASQYRAEASNAMTAGYLGAATNLFSGFADIYKNRGSVQMSV